LVVIYDTLPAVDAGQLFPAVLGPGLVQFRAIRVGNHRVLGFAIFRGVEVIRADIGDVAQLGEKGESLVQRRLKGDFGAQRRGIGFVIETVLIHILVAITHIQAEHAFCHHVHDC